MRRVRSDGPQHVTVHGRDEVVVISADMCQPATQQMVVGFVGWGVPLRPSRYVVFTAPVIGAVNLLNSRPNALTC